jgi:hypothetical protein
VLRAGYSVETLSYYWQLQDGVELRLHDTPLYNVHAYGILAAHTPVLHLRR